MGSVKVDGVGNISVWEALLAPIDGSGELASICVAAIYVGGERAALYFCSTPIRFAERFSCVRPRGACAGGGVSTGHRSSVCVMCLLCFFKLTEVRDPGSCSAKTLE
jgi:hypothetical protein